MNHQKNTWMLKLHCKVKPKGIYRDICLSVYIYIYTHISMYKKHMCHAIMYTVLWGFFKQHQMFVVSTMETALMVSQTRGTWFFTPDFFFEGKVFLLCNRKMWRTALNLLFFNLYQWQSIISILSDTYLVCILRI